MLKLQKQNDQDLQAIAAFASKVSLLKLSKNQTYTKNSRSQNVCCPKITLYLLISLINFFSCFLYIYKLCGALKKLECRKKRYRSLKYSFHIYWKYILHRKLTNVCSCSTIHSGGQVERIWWLWPRLLIVNNVQAFLD